MKTQSNKESRRSASDTQSYVCAPIRKYDASSFAYRQAEVVQETEVSVEVNGHKEFSINCSPWEIKECVMGFLFSQGVINAKADLISYQYYERTHEVRVEVDEYRAAREEDSSSWSPGEKESLSWQSLFKIEKFHDSIIEPLEVNRLIGALESECRLFHRTGGVHSAALATKEGVICRKEDVSRQSALDRLIGHCLLQDIDMRGKILLFSGRMPQSIVMRIVRMGCIIAISPGAPTDLSINMAQEGEVTLIGFAKHGCFNIYTHVDRVAYKTDYPIREVS